MKYDHANFNAQRAYASEINERIEKFLPMVHRLAWFYEGSCGGSLDVDDLLQAGMIALTEVVVHGWDVAVSAGLTYHVSDEILTAVQAHVASFSGGEPIDGLFGAAVPNRATQQAPTKAHEHGGLSGR